MDKALRLQCNFTREKWCLEGEDPMDNFYYDNGILGYSVTLHTNNGWIWAPGELLLRVAKGVPEMES